MKKPYHAETKSDRKLRIATVIAIAVLTLVVYWQATNFGFQMYHDDEHYVTWNTHVNDGITFDSIIWAFTKSYAANWHPLTWISHMADVQIFGPLEAGSSHLINILFHLANTLLLLLVLSRMTGSFWKSAFVAALFALHPLHVESVAWISERKDVLSTFLMLLTIFFYHRWVQDRRPARYIWVALFFALGLLAKPMLVTLPLVLLILDWWPLRRTDGWKKLVTEKLVLFGLVIGSCVATYFAQHAGGAVQSLGAYSLSERVITAIVAYGAYIWKMIYPAHLAALYPHPAGGWPAWMVAASAAFFVGMTVLAATTARTRPYIAAGWLWYVITLLPVIGIVQVGEQAFADRYTYIPLTGIFVIIAWGINEKYSRKLAIPAAALIVVLAALSFHQVKFWRDSETLFQHAIQVVPNNYLAMHELGSGYARDARPDDAISTIRQSIKANPKWSVSHFTLACLLHLTGDPQGANKELDLALGLGFDLNTPDVQSMTNAIRSGAKN